MENTDFVIEHIDKEVQVIADDPSQVTYRPANTDFFIENIDDNVISIAQSLNLEPTEVTFRPANTDFFIENIDKNVILIAESLSITPSEVTYFPANTDFFVENIDKNLKSIATSLSLTPYVVSDPRPNTDMFIENIDKNVTLIKGSTNVVTVTGDYINVNLPDGGKVIDFEMYGNTTQQTYTGKNLWGGFASDFTKSIGGITFVTKTDGTITNTAGTTSATAYSAFASEATSNGLTKTLDAGTYCISGASGDITLDVCDTSGTTLATDSGNGATVTLSAQKTVFVRIRVATGKTLTAGTTKPLLESGNQPTAYEPYVGGIPSPNPSYPQNINTVTGENTVHVFGKNLYDPNSTTFSIPSKVNVEVVGNTVTMTALEDTTSGDLFVRTPIPDGLLENGETYTISCVLGDGASKKLKLQLRNRDGSNAGLSNGYSITYDDRYVLFVVENPFGAPNTLPVTAGTVCVISNIQVEKGDSETVFESFHAQEQEINLGKNLWDTTVENGFIDNSGVQQSSTYQMRTVGYIELTPNTTYTFSNTNGLVVDRVCYYNGAKTFIERSAYINNKTFTTTSTNFQFARITIRATNSGDISPSDLVEPQLEKGYNATPYSAYFAPIELCKINTYQDKIYKSDGKWYLHKEIGKAVFDGSADENWTYNGDDGSTSQFRLADSIGAVATGSNSTEAFVSNFTGNANGSTATDPCFWLNQQGLLRFRVYQSTAHNLADFKTWLGTALPSVYYVLATATDTEITNETLIEQLNTTGATELYQGDNNITIGTSNVLPTLKFVIDKY